MEKEVKTFYEFCKYPYSLDLDTQVVFIEYWPNVVSESPSVRSIA